MVLRSRLLVLMMLLIGVTGAHAAACVDVEQYSITYRDMIRPHGHARSNAVYDADLQACSAQTGGLGSHQDDTPSFKKCMLERGWRWQSAGIHRWRARMDVPWDPDIGYMAHGSPGRAC